MTEIVVDDAAISALATKFSAWETDVIDKALKEIENLETIPGAFDVADTLKKTISQRGLSLSKTLENIQKALEDISVELGKIATKYHDTEQDAAIAATELKAMIDAVAKDLPGFMKN